MSSIGGLLIRRGGELVSRQLQSRENPELIHGWLGLAIVILTAFAFIFAILWVDYTCTHVIATLAAVEVSNSHAYIRLDNSEDPLPNNDDSGETKPISSSLRSAIAHLRTHGGRNGSIWHTFRAFRMYLAYTLFTTSMGFVFPAALVAGHINALIGSVLGEFVAAMLSATWQMAWVHLVIADKSPRTSYRRKLGLKHWPRIAPAAALYNAITCLGAALPAHAMRRAVEDWSATTTAGLRSTIVLILLRGLLPGLFCLFVSLPAKAVFIRVAASMLPEEDVPIVSFDRGFGGKVRDSSGEVRLGLMDAWTSFDWDARKRYVMVVLKALAIEVALEVVGILLVMGELTVVFPSGNLSKP
ncbi:hypothetical protein BJX63DRAFT_424784 [Aspergillus granulosus]|uniref:Uncharacterized protein n=1 Tax=Aspergillus granulosus TaxID=176169 RepID=A0ABR4GYC7_9EURO